MRRPPSPLAAVVFDMDGTLLDTEILYREAMTVVCAEMGVEMNHDLHLSLIGAPPEIGNHNLLTAFGADFPVRTFRDLVHTRMEASESGGAPLKPGALDLLTRLRGSGVATGLATSTGRKMALSKLEKAGLIPLLDTVVARDDVTHGKPHPESYLLAAERLGVDPKMCVAVEDSPLGVRSAAAAGMYTIMAPDLLPPTDDLLALCRPAWRGLPEVAEMLFGEL